MEHPLLLQFAMAPLVLAASIAVLSLVTWLANRESAVYLAHPGRQPSTMMLGSAHIPEGALMVNRIARFALIAMLLFLGVTTAVGAVAVVPTLPLEWLVGSPFTNYLVPAMTLGLIGIGAFASAGLLAFGESRGATLAVLVGAAIMVFEVVETLVVGLDVWLYALRLGPPPAAASPVADAAAVGTLAGIPIPLWLQPFYFAVGLVLVALAGRLWRAQHRQRARIHPAPQRARRRRLSPQHRPR